MKRLATLAACLLLAGCSTPATTATTQAAAPAATVTTTSPTPTAAKVTMKESCAAAEKIVADLPEIPQPEAYAAAAVKMHAVVTAGDQETQNAFSMLEKALQRSSMATNTSEILSASSNLIATLRDMQGRCETAGSSAFQ